ncbi:putative RNA-binding protein [Leptomonas seymouri]|uniref:Putative RNA-binding protein n=1 Tax=Leptomonas seymouri TaxID=5684 RepID=A0A0N0P674_LEPSE|nr:putative RNA-binding protein [Leptomonas seymouri]|eukprot:KPI87306.1 putative RNA-binding protein [Leptomonas seymouri]
MSFTHSASGTSSPALQAKPTPGIAPIHSSGWAAHNCTPDPDALRNLIVNYLPPLMNEAQVCELFGQFGKIESVKIIYDKITGESRGYGFVKYQFFFSATYAVSCLNRFVICGKRLKVAYASAQAAKAAYEALRLSTTALNFQQQQAMQSMYFNQMMLLREEGALMAQTRESDKMDANGNVMGSYAASQRSGASSLVGGGVAAPFIPGATRSLAAPITPIGI